MSKDQKKRKSLKKKLETNKLLVFVGAYNSLVSLMIEEFKFDGVYISGAVLSNNRSIPDIGKISLDEVLREANSIHQVTQLPSLVDLDTGFGNTEKKIKNTILLAEKTGLSSFQIEDQVMNKRCGHLKGKSLISVKKMSHKIKTAHKARKDKNFLIVARTDARSVEGLHSAIDRALSYVDSGADMIFPEALKNKKEFEIFRKHIPVPLVANMTEFGRSQLLDQKTLEDLGYNIVIYPVTTMRLALYAVQKGLKQIKNKKTQKHILNQMQTRKELYKLLKYKV